MARGPIALSRTNGRKVVSVFFAVAVFAVLSMLTSLANERPVDIGVLNGVVIGLGIGVFEEFYVQGSRGGWIRDMHPLSSIPIYVLLVATLYFAATHFSHWVLGRMDDLPVAYTRLPYGLAFSIGFSVVGVLIMRVAHFIGHETLFHLMVGTYQRPVLEAKVLLFLDINGSTALGERLGAFAMRSLVKKFLLDVSKAIIDNNGGIYLYKGDGLIAVWDWSRAIKDDTILRSIDAIFAAILNEKSNYQELFGVVPTFRIGVHGGEVIVSEQGDTKRSIGIYGDAVNIAAGMEEAAKVHGVLCVISQAVADALSREAKLQPLGQQYIKGLSTPVQICAYYGDVS
jgi:adenylate cyclase